MPYLPGSFFLTQIGGATGFAIALGQTLAGAPSRYSHAGIVLAADGTVLEAEPGGARIANLSEYAGRALLISDAPVQQWLAGDVGLEGCASCQFGLHDACAGTYVKGSYWADCQCRHDSETEIRDRLVAEARKLGPHDGKPGVGYSPLDYLALALIHLEKLLTRRPRPTWPVTLFIRRRVKSSGHMICSQLVDAVLANAGIHLFSNGRLPGDVMPSDLAAWAEDHR